MAGRGVFSEYRVGIAVERKFVSFEQFLLLDDNGSGMMATKCGVFGGVSYSAYGGGRQELSGTGFADESSATYCRSDATKSS
jgi:hypothetical protein